MPLEPSKIELRGKLENARVTRGVVLPKERAEHSGATGRPEVVGNRQPGIVVEDGAPSLSRAVGDVRGPVNAGELSVIEYIESLKTQL